MDDVTGLLADVNARRICPYCKVKSCPADWGYCGDASCVGKYYATKARESGLLDSPAPKATKSKVDKKQDDANDYEYQRLLARENAKARRSRELAGEIEEPRFELASDIANASETEVDWIIDGFIDNESVTLLTAEAGAGKTTMVTDLVRGLTTGSDVFGRYPVVKDVGNILVTDTELTRNQMGRRLRLSMPDGVPGNLSVVMAKGEERRWDVTNDDVRNRIIRQLKQRQMRVWIIDCVGPIMAACGIDENDNSAVGQLRLALAEIMKEADLSALIIVHHTGHDARHSRGAKVWEDFATNTYYLKKAATGNETSDADVRRVLSAQKAREFSFHAVDLPRDPETGHLTAVSRDERDEIKRINVISTIADVVRDNPGIAKTNVNKALRERGVQGGNDELRDLVEAAISEIPLRAEKVTGGRGTPPTVLYLDE